jgi:hypothetical protein
MQQPSAQGIASLYRGNPQPLQQSIQKDQQAKPGLPPDLQKMLALQIVTNEKDSVTAQKAMDQLQQMAGPSGKPPTVMQSLQQQAEQKLQAQAVQAQQKQQGIQSLMQKVPAEGVPEGTPQPEDQPEAQGIDQLPAEFEMAEGGIVAFQNRGEVPDPLDDANLRAQQALERLRAYGLRQRQQDPEGFSVAQQEYERARAEVAAAERQITGGPAGAMGRAMDMPPPKPAQTRPSPAAPVDVANQSAAETARLQRQTSLPQAPAPAPVKDIKELAAQKIVTAAPAPAPVVEEVPAPAAQSDAQKMLAGRMNASPEDQDAAAVARFQKMVGAPDTAQYDRLIAELEKRKESLAPKQGFEGLMEYLGEISRADSRGRGSFAAGAAGAARLNDLNKERALQQFELSKQAVEVSQKKLDTVRAYAEKKYNIGKAAFDQVYKDQYDAAKEIVKDEAAAKKLAQENTLKLLEIRAQQGIAANRDATSLAASGALTESKFIDDWRAKPENKGKSFSDAYSAFKNTALAAKEPQNRAQLIQKYADSWNKMDAIERANLKKEGIANREQYIEDMLRISGLDGGKEQSFGAPPPGAVRLKTPGG